MAGGDWYYQIDDEVHGPVSMNFLQTAYAKGKLRSRHLIRFREEGDWKPANYFRQMVEAREKYQKLLEKQKAKRKKKTGIPDLEGETDDAIEAPTEVRSPEADPLMSDPWYGILTKLFTEAGLMPEPFDSSDRVWFMWVGRKLGPFSFQDLVKMGQEGTLKVTDWVSHADSEDWTPLSPEAEAAESGEGALSDSSTDIAAGDSNVFALSDSNASIDSDSAVVSPGYDSDSGMMQSPGSPAQDSGTYGMPDMPAETQGVGAPQYRRKVKAAPPKLPDQMPSPTFVDADDDEKVRDEEESNLAAKAAAQLLMGGPPPKKEEQPDPAGMAAAMPASPGGMSGDVRGSAAKITLPESEPKKPVVERIKEGGPRVWGQLAVGAIVGLYVLNMLIGMIPSSDHDRYQAILEVYGDVKALKEAKGTTNSEWNAFFDAAVPALEQNLLPIVEDSPEAGSGRHLLLQGGNQMLSDIQSRMIRSPDYQPWFLQDLNKAAESLGYSPPPDVPAGEKPQPVVIDPDAFPEDEE